MPDPPEPKRNHWSDDADGWGPGREKWTPHGKAYWRGQSELYGYLDLSEVMAKTADQLRVGAAKALERVAPKSHMRGARQRSFAQTHHLYERLRREVTVTRTVDNYTTYVTDVMSEFHRRYPGSLKGKDKKISVELVLDAGTIGNVIDALTEARVHDLAHQSLGTLADYLKGQHDIGLFATKEGRAAAELAAERRNLIVHNRGVINRVWIKRVGAGHGDLGDRINLSPADIRAGNVALHDSVRHVEDQLQLKFAILRTQPFQPVRDPIGMEPWADLLSGLEE
jgi:hypothetical protein